VNSKGQVKVMDFGLAKLKGALKLTKTSSTAGTLAYMSPEQIQGGEVDARADIFAFGVVFFEMFTGKLPFRGEHEAAMMYSIVNESPIPIGSLQPNVSSAVASIINGCLEKDKTNRFQSFDEILAGLREVQQQSSGYMPSQALGVPRRSNAIWLGVIAVGVLILGLLLYQFVFNATSASTSTVPTIAVLYLENMTEDPKFDSFSAGMTEEIINELSNVPGVQVVSRNDVRQYQNKAVDIREVGEKLGVSYVLEGSIRVEGKQLRITCQAIQTHDRFHFWSQGYTRQLTNAFAVQSDIAQQVALALKTKFAQKNAEQKLGLPANSLLKQ
jgi:TolB-like protein